MEGLIPLFPLDLVLLPEMPLPLHIFEPRYREMVGECLRDKKGFGIVRVKSGGAARNIERSIERCGCTAEIMDVVQNYADGRMDIFTIGRRRFEIRAINEERSFYQAEVSFIDDDAADTEDAEVRQCMLDLHTEVLTLISSEVTKVDEGSNELSFQLLAALPVDLDFKQTLLEMRSEAQRQQLLLDYYTKILPQLQTLAFRQQRSGTNGWVN
jgi:Lon protease-like protein